MKVTVSLSLNVYECLTYEYSGSPSDLYPGIRVVVPVGRQIQTAWVMSIGSDYSGRTRKIIGIIRSHWRPDGNTIRFVKSLSDLYLLSAGFLLDYCLPSGRKTVKDLYTVVSGKSKKASAFSSSELIQMAKKEPLEFFTKKDPVVRPLSPGGTEAADFRLQRLIGRERFKTYINTADMIRKAGKSLLIIVPDRLSMAYFKRAIPDLDIYHSSEKKSIRDQIWEKYAAGEGGIIIGGLSALFLPIQNLAAIIVEQGNTLFTGRGQLSGDTDFKIIAKKRAEALGCQLIIGTPCLSIQQYKNQSEKASAVHFPETQPIEVIRIKRNEKDFFSQITQLVKGYHAENKRVLILLNRIKPKALLYCDKCKKNIRCEKCKRYLGLEKQTSGVCPHCQATIPSNCPRCSSHLSHLKFPSTDTLEQVFKEQVSDSQLLSISADESKDPVALEKSIHQHRIVISTPFIIGPYFYDMFDAVIYYRPESHFDMDSYRSAEQIFNLLSEIRNFVHPKGNIDLFSAYHFRYVFKLINEPEEFFRRELKYREWFFLPPFHSVYEINIQNTNKRDLGKQMRKIYHQIKSRLNIMEIRLLSETRIRGKFRGMIQIHGDPGYILSSGLYRDRNLTIRLVYPAESC